MSPEPARIFDPKLSWNSPKDDIINDFYRPALANCRLYQRLSGYFSSTTFSAIASEILDFIQSDGRMQIITSPNLSLKDKELLEQSVAAREAIVEETFLEDMKSDPDGMKLEFFRLLGYMLANTIDGRPQLEVRIAIPKKGGGMFHQKIGVMHYDDGEKIAFAGSVNETWKGWNENIENLTVFRSWAQDDTNERGLVDNQARFNELWNNDDENIDVFDLPTAVRDKLLEISPKSEEEFKSTMDKIRSLLSEEPVGTTHAPPKPKVMLKEHQHDALNRWMENGCRGLLQMATGSGKTYTAFGCISALQKRHPRTLVIIACPQKHLVEQWKNASEAWNRDVGESDRIRLGFQTTCNSDYNRWREELSRMVYDLESPQFGSGDYIQNHMVVFTTHDTLEKPDLLEKVLAVKDIKTILIVDEVHNVTEKKSQVILRDEFDFRLGLSATPTRHLDDDGTQALLDYFHDIVYELNIGDAIRRNILCPYDYFPSYVELTPDESDEYGRLSALIAQIEEKKRKGTYDPDAHKFDPYQSRANLVANAANKDKRLGEILECELDNTPNHMLIYCTSNASPVPSDEPCQLSRVQKILFERGIQSDSVTWEDKTMERLAILENLKNNHLDCVTAIKCLDEGVDVPDVHTGILMASSGNPKQFIQRRGRILRKSEITGKKLAIIYDILVIPIMVETGLDEYSISQRRLVARELSRHKEFALTARNRDDALERFRDVAKLFGIDLDRLNDKYIKSMN